MTSAIVDRSVQGSLRQFIVNSNATVGVQETANFSIGGGGQRTIALAAALPTITDAVLLDATTQELFGTTPLIELDGTGAGAGTHGLTITAGGSMVRGFVINDFAGRGIYITGGGGNTVAGNYIGTDIGGTLDRGNAFSGVFIENSANNVVGGINAADRNVIAGNQFDGISINGAAATGNVVRGNYIGLNAAGNAHRKQ